MSSIIRYTSAPQDYDGFGTVTIEENCGTNAGRQYRKVAIAERHCDWQVLRYNSGMHAAFNEDDWQYQVNAGFVELPPPAAQSVARVAPSDLSREELEALAAAAYAVFDSVESVNRGVWQVPHEAMCNLIKAQNAAYKPV